MRHKIYLSRSRRGLKFGGAKFLIKRAVFAALSAEKITAPCEVSILLTDDGGICALNREFRKLDKPTDVLSFPANTLEAGNFDPGEAEKNLKTGRITLGDMAVSLERVEAQARELGHGKARELQYLTVHSVLHLLGYDHMDEGEEKRRMREREKVIMALLTKAEGFSL